ncbi:MAG: NAD(P)H-hydrate dehydratase [Burkholderiaceae bacterium]
MCTIAQPVRRGRTQGRGNRDCDAAGRWGIVDTGGPALGVGGTGDVLAGALAALLAQGLDGWHAAALAAWAHGEAGDRWSIAHPKGIGLSSTDLPALITESLNAQ